MSDNDDLFEFEDFDDNDLELDLDDLFGDLATLAIDTEDPSLLDPFAAPAEVEAPAAAPAAAASHADVAAPTPTPPVSPQPQAEPVAAAPVQPVAAPVAQPTPVQPAAAPPVQPVAAAPVQPVAPQPEAVAGQLAGVDPATLQPQPKQRRLSKVGLAVGAAAVVTCANLAAMAIPHLTGGDDPTDPTGPVGPGDVGQPHVAQVDDTPSAEELAMLARIAELEAKIQGMGSPTAGIHTSRGDHNRTIDEARSMVSRGDFVGARKRLYSLLAIVDRLPRAERDRNEALASYLLADTYKLEAQALAQEAGL